MSPDEFAALLRQLEKLEKRLDEVQHDQIPGLVAQGTAWHSSMLTALGNNDKHIVSLPSQFDDRYILRREADERRQETQNRVVTLETRSETCVSRREADELHRTFNEGLHTLRAQVEVFVRDHPVDHRKDAEAHQKVHDRIQDEHQRLLYWILGAYAGVLLMLANTILHIFPDGH